MRSNHKTSTLGINAERLKQMKVGRKFSYVFNRLLVFMLVASLALIFTVIYCIVQYRTMYNKYYATAEYVADARGNMQSLAKNVEYVILAETESIKQERLGLADSDSEALSIAIEELRTMYPASDVVKDAEETYNKLMEEAVTFIAMVNEGADQHELYKEFEDNIAPTLAHLKEDILKCEETAHGNASKAYGTALVVAVVFTAIAVVLVLLLLLYRNLYILIQRQCLIDPMGVQQHLLLRR